MNEIIGGQPSGKFVTANDLNVYYKEIGTGIPLILLHGGTDTHKVWDPFVTQFSRYYRVITPDSRGHGRTINPAPDLSYRVMADDLASFIQELDLDNPYIFGYSDGGQVALDFSMRYPDLARAMVIGGAWYRFSREYQDALKNAGFEGPGEVNFDTIEKNSYPGWIDRMRASHPNPDPDYYQTLLKDISTMWWTPLNYQLEDFQKITAPTLILMAENDEMIPLTEAREMAEMIPGAELAVIPTATHNDVVTEDSQALDLILNFLQD